MARDRNTMAKRQREVEKREKAAKKREKREQRLSGGQRATANWSASEEESKVLAVFSRFLVVPGQMLCLSGTELVSHRRGLDKLVEAGLLEPETFQGGYSLTVSGFEAMKMVAAS